MQPFKVTSKKGAQRAKTKRKVVRKNIKRVGKMGTKAIRKK